MIIKLESIDKEVTLAKAKELFEELMELEFTLQPRLEINQEEVNDFRRRMLVSPGPDKITCENAGPHIP